MATVELLVNSDQVPASKIAPKTGGAKSDRSKKFVLLLRGLIDVNRLAHGRMPAMSERILPHAPPNALSPDTVCVVNLKPDL